ncbi:MAG: DNA repair protein RecO [Parcubacteria group bacterium GW2011_GWA2_38_13b]|nr:MAG: DNA repair protein RecO [Parcubacteria group bacterium GW2011_GWA2_38_13b]
MLFLKQTIRKTANKPSLFIVCDLLLFLYMYKIFQTQGIIINEEERGESDRVLTVFTENFGKIRLYARGSRKIKSKLAGRLALFNHANIYFIRGKKREIITDAYILNNFVNTRQNLDRIKIAFYVGNLIDNLVVASECDKKLWTAISWIFENIERGVIYNENNVFLRLFEIKTLEYLGYLPDFSKNNPFDFNPRILQILRIISSQPRRTGRLALTEVDLRGLKSATGLMLNMIY